MLHAQEMGNKFWAEAVAMTVYLKNHSPTKALDSSTPEEAWFGWKPSVNHLQVFGCKAFIHVPDQKCTKLESKMKECIFVGYSNTSKAYRFFDPATKAIIKSRDIIFDEQSNKWTQDKSMDTENLEIPVMAESQSQT